MSRPRPVPDAERTAIMLDLIGVGHLAPQDTAMPPGSVALEEVAPGTGWSAVTRYADVLVLGIWKGSGQRLDGFEIKASRADLKRELADLAKHEAVARYCDTWTLVAWDDAVAAGLTIPQDWGYAITVDVDGDRVLKVVRKPATREPQPWPRSFVCSLVRNAYQQSPGAAYLARTITAAQKQLDAYGARRIDQAISRAVRPLAEALYGKRDWDWPKEAHNTEAVIRVAVARLMQGELAVAAASPTPEPPTP